MSTRLSNSCFCLHIFGVKRRCSVIGVPLQHSSESELRKITALLNCESHPATTPFSEASKLQPLKRSGAIPCQALRANVGLRFGGHGRGFLLTLAKTNLPLLTHRPLQVDLDRKALNRGQQRQGSGHNRSARIARDHEAVPVCKSHFLAGYRFHRGSLPCRCLKWPRKSCPLATSVLQVQFRAIAVTQHFANLKRQLKAKGNRTSMNASDRDPP